MDAMMATPAISFKTDFMKSSQMAAGRPCETSRTTPGQQKMPVANPKEFFLDSRENRCQSFLGLSTRL
jgi:hypothetical protein